MTVYLARFNLKNKIAYKIGHTKFFYAHKRFDHEQYGVFDKIEILNEIRISDENAQIARDKAKLIEACLKALFPKNFYLEEYFQTQPNVFDGLSGITEMFILNNQPEDSITTVFNKIKREVQKI